ncbi:MAG: transketolase C-terminal domain-containing protein, partial [Candidatus Desantisbacteria bacterium]
DCQLIAQMVLKTGRFLTVEDNALQGGFGSAILEMLQEQGISGFECKRLGLPDSFICHGSVKILRRACGLDEEGIYTAARVLMGKQKERTCPVFDVKAPFSPDIINPFLEKNSNFLKR